MKRMKSKERHRVLFLILVGLSLVVRQGIAQQQDFPPKARNKPQPIKAVVVTAYPNGFYPAFAEVSDRRIMLVVQKRDGRRPMEFSIDRLGLNDQPIAQLQRGQASARVNNWAGVLDLQPGKYRLTEVGPAPRVFTFTIR